MYYYAHVRVILHISGSLIRDITRPYTARVYRMVNNRLCTVKTEFQQRCPW